MEPTGSVYDRLKLLNAGDVILFKCGMLEEGKIRHLEVEAVVDTGASNIVFPKHVALQLGPDYVRYSGLELGSADIQRAEVVGPVEIRFENQNFTVSGIVMGNEVLLGSIPMQDMDVVVDARRDRLVVNPESPYLPKMKVKVTRTAPLHNADGGAKARPCWDASQSQALC